MDPGLIAIKKPPEAHVYLIHARKRLMQDGPQLLV